MDRRKALQQLGILTGGMVLLPGCDLTEEKVALSLNTLKITATEALLMKDLVGTMIPEGTIPGARSLKVDDFVWVMADDCLETSSQQSFLSGLRNFDTELRKIASKSFADLEQEERCSLLADITKDNEDSTDAQLSDLISFIKITKYFTQLGYMQSSHIMTEVMPYSLVPGSYGTCETVDNLKRINIYG